MTTSKKIELLKKLINKSSEITVRNSDDPTFKVWKNMVERTLIRVYGNESFELTEFKKLKFFYNPMMYMMGDDFTHQHRECFDRDLDMSTKLFNSLIEELSEDLEEEVEQPSPVTSSKSKIKKVFISHSSNDTKEVEEIVDLLETIGLSSDQIFCSSFEGYGIDLGEDFLDRIKNELDENVLVIFILSNNFYESPVCLCEMGATWIKTNEHIPILIPPFDYSDVKGVIPLTQGFKINEGLKLNLLKEKIEKTFELTPIDFSSWERKRDRMLKRLE